MPKNLSYTSLDSIITDYLNESEQSNNKYFKLFHLAFRGMDDLGLDFFYQIQTFKLPVNANLTVNLPANCLKVVKAGVLNGSGEIIPITSNSKLTTYADLLPNRIGMMQDNTVFNWDISTNGGWYYNFWANGDGYINLYGIPSGQPDVGTYTIDEANGLLVLSENFAFPYVMVECLCSPVEGQDYYLPDQFREALLAWLAWLDIRNIPSSRRGNLGDKRDRRAEFYNQRRLAIARYSPFRVEDAYQSSLENVRMAIKG